MLRALLTGQVRGQIEPGFINLTGPHSAVTWS